MNYATKVITNLRALLTHNINETLVLCVLNRSQEVVTRGDNPILDQNANKSLSKVNWHLSENPLCADTNSNTLFAHQW